VQQAWDSLVAAFLQHSASAPAQHWGIWAGSPDDDDLLQAAMPTTTQGPSPRIAQIGSNEVE
jgi:hypothetical protein